MRSNILDLGIRICLEIRVWELEILSHMARPYLSIIIPTHNDAERLPLALLEIDRILGERAYSYEILVIDDNSEDATSSVVSRLADFVKNLKVVDNNESRGKGYAIRKGMLLARGSVRVVMNPDKSVSVDHLDIFLPHLKNGFDAVVGSRAHKESAGDPRPFHKKIAEALAHKLLVRPFLLKEFSDGQCNFRVFKADAAEAIFGQCKLDGAGCDIEALALARKLGRKVKEAPVKFGRDSENFSPSPSLLHILMDAIRIWWWLRRSR